MAAIGLVLGKAIASPETLVLFCILTAGLYLLELRNRGLLGELSERAMQIENEYWKYEGLIGHDPLVSLQHKPGPRYTKIFGKTVPAPWFVRHGIALDLIYLSVFVYFLGSFVVWLRCSCK